MDENIKNTQDVAIDEETKKELENRKKGVLKFFLYSILVVVVFATGFVLYNLYPNLSSKFDVNIKDKFFESSMVDTTLNDEILNIDPNNNQKQELQINNTDQISNTNNNKGIKESSNNNKSIEELYHIIAFSSNDQANIKRYMKKFRTKDFKCTLLENNGNIRLSIKSFDNYQDAKKFVGKCKIKYKTLCKDIWILNPNTK